jgi:hypothetical protein
MNEPFSSKNTESQKALLKVIELEPVAQCLSGLKIQVLSIQQGTVSILWSSLYKEHYRDSFGLDGLLAGFLREVQ